MVGDGEAETGPLAASWHSNKFLDPRRRRRGAADPAPQRLQDRQPDGARPDPATTSSTPCCAATATSRSSSRATTPPTCTSAWPRPSTRPSTRSRRSRRAARDGGGRGDRPAWPMIVLRTPKGWTGPKEVDGQPVEGTWRSHQVPLAGARRATRPPARCSRSGCAPTARRSCSTTTGARADDLLALAPAGPRRMSANPHANGGLLLRPLRAARLPRLRRRGRRAGRRDGASRPACWAASCAT